jgi:type IV pilus assembly protein PilB
VATHNIDDILNELGLDDAGGGRPPKRSPDPKSANPTKGKGHRIDKAKESFAPLPAMPSGQRRYGHDENAPPTPDPAVKNAPIPAPKASVGEALSEIYSPEEGESGGAELGEILIERQIVTPEQMTAARQVLRQSPGGRLSTILIEQGADEASIQSVVAEIAGVPFERVDLDKGLEGGFDGTMLQRLGTEYCKMQAVLPLRMDGARLVVGATSADDVFLLDEIKSRLGVPGVKLVLVTSADLRAAFEMVGAGQQDDVDLSDLLDGVDEADVEVDRASAEGSAVDLEQQAGESPVIRYVNYIIQTAVKEGASDIHIEPAEKKLKVRFRIDGVLFEMMNPPASMSSAITSRLKIMANLDISERRVPQDGRIRCTVGGRKLDLRVSTLPSGYGEKTVMRILDTKSIQVELADLGFDDTTYQTWRKEVTAPHGIILVTGPTGSGKTTTLYASLRQLDKNKLNISTVEDPIEYHLDGITQTQTHEKIGMTFAKALKALLRQDPDVIMLGEIRDHETAHTAVQAALTGHLVLSTLHTNDAPSSVTRLVNIGLEPFLVGAALNGVLAQRLVRRLCKECAVEEQPSEELREYLEIQGMPTEKTWVAKGCDRCRSTGYSGRVGIYELLTVDDQLRDVVARNPNVSEFRRMCLERGMTSLREDGMRKVSQGLTTIQEILRVTEASI